MNNCTRSELSWPNHEKRPCSSSSKSSKPWKKRYTALNFSLKPWVGQSTSSRKSLKHFEYKWHIENRSSCVLMKIEWVIRVKHLQSTSKLSRINVRNELMKKRKHTKCSCHLPRMRYLKCKKSLSESINLTLIIVRRKWMRWKLLSTSRLRIFKMKRIVNVKIRRWHLLLRHEPKRRSRTWLMKISILNIKSKSCINESRVLKKRSACMMMLSETSTSSDKQTKCSNKITNS